VIATWSRSTSADRRGAREPSAHGNEVLLHKGLDPRAKTARDAPGRAPSPRSGVGLRYVAISLSVFHLRSSVSTRSRDESLPLRHGTKAFESGVHPAAKSADWHENTQSDPAFASGTALRKRLQAETMQVVQAGSHPLSRHASEERPTVFAARDGGREAVVGRAARARAARLSDGTHRISDTLHDWIGARGAVRSRCSGIMSASSSAAVAGCAAHARAAATAACAAHARLIHFRFLDDRARDVDRHGGRRIGLEPSQAPPSNSMTECSFTLLAGFNAADCGLQDMLRLDRARYGW